MLEIRKSHEADSDIESIWQFSFEQWGESRADRYYDKLEDGITQLTHTPAIGRARDEIREGLRAYHVGRHFIYYYVRDDHVYVVRVRHDKSDPALFEE